jgi:hypothetical protein
MGRSGWTFKLFRLPKKTIDLTTFEEALFWTLQKIGLVTTYLTYDIIVNNYQLAVQKKWAQ